MQALADRLLLALGDLAREHAVLLGAGLLGLVLVQTLRLAISKSAASRRIARHRSLGLKGEKRARSLLRRAGYNICEEQVLGSYSLWVGSLSTKVYVRADFIVERRGRKYVAEVKAGAESSKVTLRTTRRQLLEYLFAFESSGVLLVDVHAGEVHHVQFPPLKAQQHGRQS